MENSQGYVRNFLGISFFTEMRGGEILALTWDDIDFVTNFTIGVYTHFMPRKEKMVIGFLEKRYKTGTHHS